jgi:death-on-curing protein
VTPVWLARTVVLAIHTECLRAHGGADGVRDEGLLESALARPQHAAAYVDADLCRLAAAYAVGIARNHPFVDGNKRTALLAATVFLERNGLRFTASSAEAVVFTLGIADGTLAEAAFAQWLRANTRSGTRRPRPGRRTKRRR